MRRRPSAGHGPDGDPSVHADPQPTGKKGDSRSWPPARGKGDSLQSPEDKQRNAGCCHEQQQHRCCCEACPADCMCCAVIMHVLQVPPCRTNMLPEWAAYVGIMCVKL